MGLGSQEIPDEQLHVLCYRDGNDPDLIWLGGPSIWRPSRDNDSALHAQKSAYPQHGPALLEQGIEPSLEERPIIWTEPKDCALAIRCSEQEPFSGLSDALLIQNSEDTEEMDDPPHFLLGDNQIVIASQEESPSLLHDYFEKLEVGIPRKQRLVAQRILMTLVSEEQVSVASLLGALERHHSWQEVGQALEIMQKLKLVRKVQSTDDAPSWRLADENLCPTVRKWLDIREAQRDRAREVVVDVARLAQHKVFTPLSLTEVRQIRAQQDLIDELKARPELFGGDLIAINEAERVIRRSERRYLVRRGSAISLIALLMTVVVLGLWQWHQSQLQEARQKVRQSRQEVLQKGNIGRSRFIVSVFEWDGAAGATRVVPLDDSNDLSLALYEPDPNNPDEPGEQGVEATYRRTEPKDRSTALALVMTVEARGGRAFLRVSGRGMNGRTCSPSWIRIDNLPGYGERTRMPPREMRVAVPSCSASIAETVPIPAGYFYKSGPGNPPLQDLKNGEPEQQIDLPFYRISKNEVTNGEYQALARLSEVTTREMTKYPAELGHLRGERYPVSAIIWQGARDYCRFLGGDLPTSAQWEKAARGGISLASGDENPHPRRNFPWGIEDRPNRANLAGEQDGSLDVAPIDGFPEDVSPYGVRNMAGNVLEWTRSWRPDGLAIVRGGNAYTTPPFFDVYRLSYENARLRHFISHFGYGFRCVFEGADVAAP